VSIWQAEGRFGKPRDRKSVLRINKHGQGAGAVVDPIFAILKSGGIC
jgi:hypothetical protein